MHTKSTCHPVAHSGIVSELYGNCLVSLLLVSSFSNLSYPHILHVKYFTTNLVLITSINSTWENFCAIIFQQDKLYLEYSLVCSIEYIKGKCLSTIILISTFWSQELGLLFTPTSTFSLSWIWMCRCTSHLQSHLLPLSPH